MDSAVLSESTFVSGLTQALDLNKSMPEPVLVESSQPVVQKAPKQAPKLSVAELLSQCASTIEELTVAVEDAQIKGEPLSFYTGSRVKLAQQQLINQELIEVEVIDTGKRKVNSVRLTARGLEARIGTHVYGSDASTQRVRYMPEVMAYLTLPNKQKPKASTAVPKYFVDPEGELVRVENLSQFCRDNGLHRGKMHLVWTDVVKSHKGWQKI